MLVIREVQGFKINKGDGMARGLYNITNEEILAQSETEGVSLWFDEESKDEYMALSDEDFVDFAKIAIK